MKKNIGSILLIIALLIIAVALKSVADVMHERRNPPTPTEIPDSRIRGPEEVTLKIGESLAIRSITPGKISTVQVSPDQYEVTFLLTPLAKEPEAPAE